MIDLILIKESMMKDVYDVRSIRYLSEHMVVLYKLRLLKVWFKSCKDIQKGSRVGSEKLREVEKRKEYKREIVKRSGEISDKGLWKKCGRE